MTLYDVKRNCLGELFISQVNADGTKVSLEILPAHLVPASMRDCESICPKNCKE